MKERRPARSLFALALAALLVIWVFSDQLPKPGTRTAPMSELLHAIDDGKVASVEIGSEQLTAQLRASNGDGRTTLVVERLPNMDESKLVDRLRDAQVDFSGRAESGPKWMAVLGAFVPFLLLAALLAIMSGALGARGRPLSFGRSRAKLYDQRDQNGVTFADVAGVDEAKGELAEVVSFLKDPAKYVAVGARIPKGVLLVGPPGTGKTLLARAVAGESGAPFFSLSGSEFVEMFVGVGAARVRDLFEQAKERAPCIIFIDELDAIGKTRAGAAGFAANEEREQTLNQLLVEMDGFDSGRGLIIMAATNRPEILDRALLRAGRFDRQVVVDRPDVRGREAILHVHAAKIKLGSEVDLRVVAQRTPGMVGADLANVVNEAALASVRRGGPLVELRDFEEAVDRIQLGLKKEGRVMTDDEKRRVAYHEAGHALVALTVEHADPVHRVTIIPRGVGSLGATLQLPTDDRYLMTRSELTDQLCVLMGGRAAEGVACQEVSTGAQNDLERATELARQMVTRFGMSDKLGPQTFGRALGLRFLAPIELGSDRNYGERTAQAIDAEIREVLDTASERARRILITRRASLERIATQLLERETLNRDELGPLLGDGTDRPALRPAS